MNEFTGYTPRQDEGDESGNAAETSDIADTDDSGEETGDPEAAEDTGTDGT